MGKMVKKESELQLKFKGGARIGWVNATWPFASLYVTSKKIILKTIMGRYEFNPDQIASLEKYSTIPFFSNGIRINHTVAKYSPKIVFWCFDDPQRIIDQISEIGFLPSTQIIDIPKRQGIPVRWQAIVFGLVLWNFLFIMDMFYLKLDKPGFFSFIAILFVFIVSVFLSKSLLIQRIVMKPGRNVEEIKHWLGLFTLVSGFGLFLLGLSLLLLK